MTVRPISILIAEDQNMVLGALSVLLNLEDDMEVIQQASNGLDALEKARQTQPDIVLTDIEMPEMTGLELAEKLREEQPQTRVIILTTFARSGYLRRAMDAGVKGYLLKDAPSEQLADAVRKVMQGRKIIDPELVTEAWGEQDPLNDRERQILRLAGEGKKTEEIAEKLHLSSGTVRNYLSSAASKLNARNRIEAARMARQQGWL